MQIPLGLYRCDVAWGSRKKELGEGTWENRVTLGSRGRWWFMTDRKEGQPSLPGCPDYTAGETRERGTGTLVTLRTDRHQLCLKPCICHLSPTHPNSAQLPPDSENRAAGPLGAAPASTPEEETKRPVPLPPAPKLQGGPGARVPHGWTPPPSTPTSTPNSGEPSQSRPPKPWQ